MVYDPDPDFISTAISRFATWNKACDATLHVRVLSPKANAEALKRLAESTGGSFKQGG